MCNFGFFIECVSGSDALQIKSCLLHLELYNYPDLLFTYDSVDYKCADSIQYPVNELVVKTETSGLA